MSGLRVAALYDVHANLPALEAVLADVERAPVDVVLVGGDVVWGPMPQETLQRLSELGDRARFVRGNADREVAARHADSVGLDEWIAQVTAWCADQLSEKQLADLSRLPTTETIDLECLGPTLFCHGSPRDDAEPITSATSERKVAEILAGVQERLVVCGHTHARFDRVARGTRIVNPGSVGLPFGDPTAYWALLGPDVDLRRSAYDVDEAAVRIRASGVPHADWFIDQIVSPPPETTAVERFTRE